MNLNRGFLLTAVSGTLYGFLGYFGAHLSQSGFTVCSFLFWRFLIATLAVVLIMALKGEKLNSNWKTILLSFFMGVAFYSGSAAFYFFSSHWIGTGLAMVVFFSYPAFVVLLSWMKDRKPLTNSTLISLGFIFFGLTLLAEQQEFHWDWRGVGFALIAAVSYALYIFFSKNQIHKLSTLASTGLVSIGSAGTFLIISLFEESLRMPANWIDWGNVLGIGLICTAIPILFLLEGLKTLDAGRASIISVLEPVVTVVVGATLLGEILSSRQMIGILVVLASATYLERSERKPEIQRRTA
jgi:drug/metabolite transporter (DMT)-like permease